MALIKLPWRRFGDERPIPNSDVLLWENGATGPAVALFISGNDPRFTRWGPPYSDTQWRTDPDDRWVYLSEIANPFEDEGDE